MYESLFIQEAFTPSRPGAKIAANSKIAQRYDTQKQRCAFKLLLLRCTLATRDQQLLIVETYCFVSPKMATIDDLKSGEGGFELKSNGTNG